MVLQYARAGMLVAGHLVTKDFAAATEEPACKIQA